MTNAPAVMEPRAEDYGAQLNVAIDDYATYSKDYHNAEKSAVSAAKARLAKATTFEEQKYWYEKLEMHTALLREHKIEAATVVIFGTLLLCGVLFLRK